MNTQIIACRTVERELTQCIQNTGVDYPILWVESGLHNTPKKLNRAVQALIDEAEADRLLLAMGFCGNSLVGLESKGRTLILPRADDCISLLLGSNENRAAIARENAAYFLTEGWLSGERNLWKEHLHAVEKYGRDQAMELARMLYSHYRTLALLDTGTADMTALLDGTEIIAQTLSLEQKIVPASLSWLENLLTGPWHSDRFLTVPPGGKIELSHMLDRP